MSKAYPRRRDVRARLFELYNVVNANIFIDDEGEAEFDREFLTSVRDYMREGAEFETAIMASADGYEPSQGEVTEEELAAFIDGLRSAALAAAGVPEEDAWDPPEEEAEEGSDYNYDY